MSVPRGTGQTAASPEVVVVGAGHAGCEAALACARSGLATALVTLRADRIAAMSCNPAIGGLGKSHIVREIDALGGEMARAADATAIHYRRLNESKGPAVRARRVQCDLGRYHRYMAQVLGQTQGLTLVEALVVALLRGKDGAIRGVILEDGAELPARAVILTTGTFLGGLIHVGLRSYPGGRLGDRAAQGLTTSLKELGLEVGRLKTGTPARLEAASVRLDRLEVQPPHHPPLSFAHGGSYSALPQLDCYLTRTREETHQIIRGSLDRSPLYRGVVRGTGPRYCPSIEDKVVRFPDRTSHQVILEPTDLSGAVFYPNGISTSLDEGTQESFIHSIPGLEAARIVEYGYAIEYDFVNPNQLRHSLEVKGVANLFLAGQINGTSGYEEAAGQGLIAGLNAVARLRDRPPVLIQRSEGYLGVMIDDLVSKGTEEPYRMFSSRAEFRLLLREDNAFLRLHPLARQLGLVSAAELARREQEIAQGERLTTVLKKTRIVDGERQISLEKALRRPEALLVDLLGEGLAGYSADVVEQVEVLTKYQGYVERQVREAERLKELQAKRLPAGIDYREVPGLSRELAEKLEKYRPDSLAAASRIQGMTPAALLLLSVWISKHGNVPRGT